MTNRFVIDKDELIKYYADILREHFGDNLNLSAGSILGNLIRSLAEIDNNLLFYFSYIINESNIYTAVLPRSIYLLARQLGYIPKKGKPLELKAQLIIRPPKEHNLYKFQLTKDSKFQLAITAKHILPLQLKYNYDVEINGLYCVVRNLDLGSIEVGHITGIDAEGRPIYTILVDFEQSEYRDFNIPADKFLSEVAYIQTVRIPKDSNKNAVNLQLTLEFNDGTKIQARQVNNFDGLMYNEYNYVYDDYGDYIEVYLSPHFAKNLKALKQLNFRIKETYTGVAEILNLNESNFKVIIGSATVIDTISQSYTIQLDYNTALVTNVPEDRDTIESIRYKLLQSLSSRNILYSIKDLEKSVTYNNIFRLFKTSLFSNLVLYSSPVKDFATNLLARTKLLNKLSDSSSDDATIYLSNPILGSYYYSEREDKLIGVQNVGINLQYNKYTTAYLIPLLVYYDKQLAELKQFAFDYKSLFEPQTKHIEIPSANGNKLLITTTLNVESIDTASGELDCNLYITTVNDISLQNVRAEIKITDTDGNTFLTLSNSVILPSRVIATNSGLTQYIFKLPVLIEPNYLKHFETTDLRLSLQLYTDIGQFSTEFVLNPLNKIEDFQFNINTENAEDVNDILLNKYLLTNLDSQTAANNLYAILRETVTTNANIGLEQLKAKAPYFSTWTLYLLNTESIASILEQSTFDITLLVKFKDNSQLTQILTLQRNLTDRTIFDIKIDDETIGYAKLLELSSLYNSSLPSAKVLSLQLYFNTFILQKLLAVNNRNVFDIKQLQITINDNLGNIVVHYITDNVEANTISYPFLANIRNVPAVNAYDISPTILSKWIDSVIDKAAQVSLLYKLRTEFIETSKLLMQIELIGTTRQWSLVPDSILKQIETNVYEEILAYILSRLQELNEIKLSDLHSIATTEVQKLLGANTDLQFKVKFFKVADGRLHQLQLDEIIKPDLSIIYPYNERYKKHIEYPLDLLVQTLKIYETSPAS